MSRFNFKYIPIANLELIHDNALLTKDFISIYPSDETKALIKKLNIKIKETPDGLLVFTVNVKYLIQ